MVACLLASEVIEVALKLIDRFAESLGSMVEGVVTEIQSGVMAAGGSDKEKLSICGLLTP